MTLLLKGGNPMSLLIKPIDKLSGIEIDVDKNWGGYGISNLKEIVASMAQGDVVYRDAAYLVKLVALFGAGYNFLHAKNTGIDVPEWYDIQEIIAYISGGVNRMVALPTLLIPTPSVATPVLSASVVAAQTITPTLLTVPAPTVAGVFQAGSPGAVGGALADDGGVQADETTEANSAAPNDMTLLPAAPAGNDAYWWGLANPFDWLALNIGQAGVGTWTIVYEYWNGAGMVALSNVYDTSNGFRNGGTQSVAFHRPGDWATSTIMLLDLYWMRARVSAYSAITTQPLGTQAWIGRWV